MSLFSKRKDLAVQSFVLKLLNNNCPGLTIEFEDARVDKRVNLVLVVMIIPVQAGKLQADRAFNVVSKEFSITGVAVVLDRHRELDQVVLGFRFEDRMTFVLAQAKHQDPLGGGFYQIGFQMLEVVTVDTYPGLASLSF